MQEFIIVLQLTVVILGIFNAIVAIVNKNIHSALGWYVATLGWVQLII